MKNRKHGLAERHPGTTTLFLYLDSEKDEDKEEEKLHNYHEQHRYGCHPDSCQSSRRTYRYHGHNQCVRMVSLVVWLAVASAIVSVYTRHQWLIQEVVILNHGNHEACSLPQLQRSFPRQVDQTIHDNKDRILKDVCSPAAAQDKLLHLPVHAIVNRNHMPLLGAGYKGNVHKALVKLRNGGDKQTKVSYCWVAVKTDHCHALLWGNINLFFDRTRQSCLQDYAFLWNDASYLAGEYTGAMLSVAAELETASSLGSQGRTTTGHDSSSLSSGLFPTWGMVVLDKSKDQPLWSRVARRYLQGTPLPDPYMVGAIMPYQPSFVSLKEYGKRLEPQHFVSSAKALLFVSRMGLAFQDILKTNIGVGGHVQQPVDMGDQDNSTRSTLHSSGSDGTFTFLYDNTYLSVQPNTPCRASQAACTTFFCHPHDPAVVVGHTYRDHQRPNKTAIESDFWAYRDILATYFAGRRPITNGLTGRRIRSCTNVEQLIQLLEESSSA